MDLGTTWMVACIAGGLVLALLVWWKARHTYEL